MEIAYCIISNQKIQTKHMFWLGNDAHKNVIMMNDDDTDEFDDDECSLTNTFSSNTILYTILFENRDYCFIYLFSFVVVLVLMWCEEKSME